MAVVVPIVAVAVVAAVVLSDSSPVAAGGDHLPDLQDRPEIAWSLDVADQFDLVASDILNSGEDWQWLADQLRDDRAGFLRDYGDLFTWDVGGNIVVVMPVVDQIGNRLHGVNAETGEIAWTSEPVASAGVAPASLRCTAMEGTRLACLSYVWDADTFTDAVALHVVDGTDGSLGAETSLTQPEGVVRLIGQDTGAAIVLSTTERRTTVTRYGNEGDPVWSTDLEGAMDVGSSSVGQRLIVRGYDYSGEDTYGWTEVLDLDTGEADADMASSGRLSDAQIDYEDWGGMLLRLDVRGDTGRRTVSLVEDGQERWWHSSEATLLAGAFVEPGAPVLLRDNGAGTVTALDPEDGAERWVYRQRGSWVLASLATSDQVVLRDDAMVVSLDAETGEVEWTRSFDGSPSFQIGATTLYELADGYRLRAIELADGEERWTFTAPPGVDDASLRHLGGRLMLVGSDGLHALR